MRVKFYNLQIDCYSTDTFLNSIANDFEENKAKSVLFINAYCFNISQNNLAYKNAILNSDYILNDGIGVKIAGILNKIRFPENLNGTDLIPKIIEFAHKNHKRIYLLGSTDSIIKKTQINLENKYSGIKIVGIHNGFFTEKEEAGIVNEINTLKTDLLIVGMGVPRQELFVNRNIGMLTNVKLCISGGAIIDFISGEIKRAPLWIRKINFEWAYRLYLEPSRMWKRYIIGNLLFFINLFKIKIS
jgi:N-acetylglucosaminyldiphosphoundecaprenol N-acetyl-beta-D-mannosaminyltransferase